MSNETEQWEALLACISNLYITFANYKLTGPILCEMSDAVVVADGINLRARAAQEFERYQFKAITTLGMVQDYKHFLPRLLELSCLQRRRRALGESAIPEVSLEEPVYLDVIARKLQYADVRRWPAGERDALASFGAAHWRWELWLPPDYGRDLRDSMTLLAVVGCLLHELLESSLRRSEIVEIHALAKFINQNVEFTIKGGGTRLRWTDHDTNASEQFERWLLQPHVEAALEKVFYEIGDGEMANELSKAVQKIGWLREMGSEKE